MYTYFEIGSFTKAESPKIIYHHNSTSVAKYSFEE